MASRLSSLLVRDGLVGVKRMERAFQRQVIYGGSLDTILLEMALLDESTLCDYLSMATGLPSATSEHLEMISSAATEVCSEELAAEFYVAPLTIEDDALRVLVCEPVDFTQLEDLADRLDMAIQPLVAPEFRFNLLLSRAFGRSVDVRFSKLAEAVLHIAPVSRPAAVETVAPVRTEPSGPHRRSALQPDAPDAPDAPEPDAPEPEAPEAPEAPEPDAPEPDAPEPDAPEPDAPEPDVPEPDAPEPEPALESEVLLAENVDGRVVDVPIPEATPSPALQVASEPIEQPQRAERVSDAYRIVRPLREPSETLHDAIPPMPADGRSRGEIQEVEPDTPAARSVAPAAKTAALSALPVSDARELLSNAADRDAIFQILLRALSTRARFAGLMINQGGTGLGRFALDGGVRSSQAIDSAAVPLDVPSPFKQVIDTGSPYIGRLASGNPEIDLQAQRLCGGEMPPSALLLPIALRDRVVAVAVAHKAPDNIEITELAEILPLAGEVAAALVRLIRDAKKRAKAMAADLGHEPAPAREPVARDAAVDKLLDDVESTDREISEAAKSELARRAAEVVPMLADRFPGRLEVDRYEVGWRTIRASQYGPIMDLVIRLGASCGPMLGELLADSRRDLRYYAAVCAAELRPIDALDALVDRVFDRDYGVRDIALHALAGYPASELDSAMSTVRSALHSDLAERVVAAANAVAVLADLRSIPHLLEVLEGERETAVPARRALRRLTCQDFAWSIRKWRSWWDKSRNQSRIEWLLDSLGHRDEELRRQAVEDLRSLTGESFDYDHDGTRREREDSRARWLDWWQREGAKRFAPDRREEHHRPTAKLPELDR